MEKRHLGEYHLLHIDMSNGAILLTGVDSILHTFEHWISFIALKKINL